MSAQCVNHSAVETTLFCSICGDPVCDECALQTVSGTFCKKASCRAAFMNFVKTGSKSRGQNAPSGRFSFVQKTGIGLTVISGFNFLYALSEGSTPADTINNIMPQASALTPDLQNMLSSLLTLSELIRVFTIADYFLALAGIVVGVLMILNKAFSRLLFIAYGAITICCLGFFGYSLYSAMEGFRTILANTSVGTNTVIFSMITYGAVIVFLMIVFPLLVLIKKFLSPDVLNK